MAIAAAAVDPVIAANRRALVFMHFDPAGCVDPHVGHAVAAYRPHCGRLVFVSNAADRLPPPLAALVDTFIPRPNVGYDFCGWRDGLATLDRADFDEIVCVNDSVYGPLFDLAPALADGRVAGADLWGMVLSAQPIRGHQSEPHVQSWFFAMRRRLLASDTFDRFWSRVVPLESKREVVARYEVGLSRQVARDGLRIAGIYDATHAPRPTLAELLPQLSAADLGRSWRLVRKGRRRLHNPSELVWWRLLDAGVPFVKVNLFRTNHYGVDLGRVRRRLQRMPAYDPALLDAHQATVALAAQSLASPTCPVLCSR